ncbi:MAG: P-loop NTPase [Desulfuromonadales bacterium]|nr:P-loop NTPase [Desulfuromonadales bacterium]
MTGSVDLEHKAPRPRIWAIGGGKGGVGKSVFSTGMAMTLAQKGERCIMLDADLGGANLHTFLGMSHPGRTLSDLFRNQSLGLKDILLSTPFENLWLISGARAMLDMANPSYLQKMKVIRQIFSLNADHIFIDLGAGSAFNVLDFFLAAHEGVVVVMPTPTSIENAYHFLKAVYYRKLRKVVRELKVERLIDAALSAKVKSGIRSPRDLMIDLQHRDPIIGEQIVRAMMPFRPRLIVNQVQRNEDRDLGKKIALACRDFFGIEMTVPGLIRTDERVLMALKSRRPVLEMFPNCPFAEDVRRIAQQMTRVRR